MLTNNDAKLIISLSKKKFRQKYNKFTVEGIKNVQEVLKSSLIVHKVYATEDVFDGFSDLVEIISEKDLKKISQQVHPNVALALCEIPEENIIQSQGLVLGLDDIRDPGNFGTIIRLADWFGIQQIVCSKETVDVYNSKVIQSTMGSFLRVQINYVDLKSFLNEYSHPIFGTFMDGEIIYTKDFPTQMFLLMGNEANGISPELQKIIDEKISIPQMGKLQETESLNVAMATGIILGEIASRKFKI